MRLLLIFITFILATANCFAQSYEELIEREDWATKYKTKNVALRSELKLRANFRAGYWEVSFLHTKPLGVVPPEMRVR